MKRRWTICMLMAVGLLATACTSTSVVAAEPSSPDDEAPAVQRDPAPVDGFRIVARFRGFGDWTSHQDFTERVDPAPSGCTDDALPSSADGNRTAQRFFRRTEPTAASVAVEAYTFATTDAAAEFMATLPLNARLCHEASRQEASFAEVDPADFGLDDTRSAAFAISPHDTTQNRDWVVFRQHERVVIVITASFLSDANPLDAADLDLHVQELQRSLAIGRLTPAEGSLYWSERQFELYLIETYGPGVLDLDEPAHQCFVDRVDTSIRWEQDWPSPAAQRENALLCASSIDVSHLEGSSDVGLRPPRFERSVPSDPGA